MNNLLNNKFSLFGPGILLAISGMVFFPPVKLVLNGAENMPVSFTTSSGSGSGYFDLSTYHTPWNNITQLPTGISEFDNAGGDDNLPFVADRFWQVNAVGYTTKPTLTNLKFTCLESEPENLFHGWVQVDVPIQLASFNAVPDGQRVKLNWITANELNNDYFTVEKSLDGRTFVFIEKVEGAGTSSRILNYSTIDYSPWSGASYYRLKQTDFDGNATYSKIISVDLGQTGALSFNLYPNPSPGGELTLKFKNATIGTLQAKIVDLVGKEVFVQGVTVANNGDFTTTISVPGKLPSGAYFVKIESNDSVYTRMFVLRKGA